MLAVESGALLDLIASLKVQDESKELLQQISAKVREGGAVRRVRPERPEGRGEGRAANAVEDEAAAAQHKQDTGTGNMDTSEEAIMAEMPEEEELAKLFRAGQADGKGGRALLARTLGACVKQARPGPYTG